MKEYTLQVHTDNEEYSFLHPKNAHIRDVNMLALEMVEMEYLYSGKIEKPPKGEKRDFARVKLGEHREYEIVERLDK